MCTVPLKAHPPTYKDPATKDVVTNHFHIEQNTGEVKYKAFEKVSLLQLQDEGWILIPTAGITPFTEGGWQVEEYRKEYKV